MEKDLHEVIETHDAEHRLLCALDGRPYQTPAERQKIALLVEALGRGAPITEALAGLREGRTPASTRIARHGDPHAPLPAGIEQRLAEALTGEPTLPDGIEARLARAL